MEEYLCSAIDTTHSLKALRHWSHGIICKITPCLPACGCNIQIWCLDKSATKLGSWLYTTNYMVHCFLKESKTIFWQLIIIDGGFIQWWEAWGGNSYKSNQIKSNQIKSNQIKSNQIKLKTHLYSAIRRKRIRGAINPSDPPLLLFLLLFL